MFETIIFMIVKNCFTSISIPIYHIVYMDVLVGLAFSILEFSRAKHLYGKSDEFLKYAKYAQQQNKWLQNSIRQNSLQSSPASQPNAI